MLAGQLVGQLVGQPLEVPAVEAHAVPAGPAEAWALVEQAEEEPVAAVPVWVVPAVRDEAAPAPAVRAVEVLA